MALWPPDLQIQYDNDRISDEINNSNGGFGDQKDDSEDENSYPKIVDRISRNRLLLACGAAAGVSSGFNAPLSGNNNNSVTTLLIYVNKSKRIVCASVQG